ncbi:STAS domain-containing protein [Micromonosporaceae bacterium Da 78-11]
MSAATVTVHTGPDGTAIVQLHGVLDADDAVGLRRTIVYVIRHQRPLRLVVDVGDLHDLDAINLGTLAAACHLGDDHRVVVFLDHSSPALAERLAAAGVPAHRLRHITSTSQGGGPPDRG